MRERPAARAGFSPAEQETAAEIEFERNLGQRRCIDHALAKIGELALGQLGELRVCDVGNDPAEHGVAEKFEPLVRGPTTHDLGTPRTVRHRLAQKIWIGERVPETFAECFEIWLSEQ